MVALMLRVVLSIEAFATYSINKMLRIITKTKVPDNVILETLRFGANYIINMCFIYVGAQRQWRWGARIIRTTLLHCLNYLELINITSIGIVQTWDLSVNSLYLKHCRKWVFPSATRVKLIVLNFS